MKKIILISLLLIPFALNAQTKNNPILDKVKAGVKKYLYLTMKDYSSYQSVEWGKLGIIRTNYLTTDRCRELLDSISTIKKPYLLDYDAFHARGEVKNLNLEADSIYQSYINLLTPIQAKITPILNIITKEELAFKKKVIGYSVYHKYRGKNSYGAYTIGSDVFTLNTIFKVESTASEEDDN